MKKYAYLDKGQILHVVEKESDAREYAKYNGKVVETEIPAAHGYPVAGGEELIVYSETDIRVYANGPKLDVSQYPALAALYRECR